jgi:hypothetical protein
MNSLPDSLPNPIKVSFFEYKRREWEKVLESAQNIQIGANQPDSLQHLASINKYALARIQEIDGQLAELKLAFNSDLAVAPKIR